MTSPDQNSSLLGRRALVTGGGTGIGRAIALALAAAGADVGVAARTGSALHETAIQVRALGRRASVAAMDVTEPASVQGAVDSIVEDLGGLDILVNNAGAVTVARLLDSEIEEWDQVIDTNLRGTFLCCRAAGRHLVAQRSGKIINISSAFGIKAFAGFSAYSASKAGIIALTKVLALELARDNVQVNAIAPGHVRTGLHAEFGGDDAFQQRILKGIPARRMADPAEIGPVAVMLASSSSDFMTGAVVTLDGGQSL